MPSPTQLTIPILGLSVTPLTAIQTAQWASKREGKRLLLNHNLHSAYIFQVDPEFRSFYERADRVVIDGAPIRVAGSLGSRKWLSSDYRIGSTDWIACLSRTADTGVLAVLGATPESNAAAVRALRHQLTGTGWAVHGLNGYRASEDLVAWLDHVKPTLVLVGMGMPDQERFLAENWEHLPAATYATVGGAIDYIAGTGRLAPRWVGRMGMEWAWRLAHDPTRLAHRYLIEPVLLAGALFSGARHRASRRTMKAS
jgi:N-acetylglucosaminyldiphosphoundecaprenol N-acetyl-beta-D-mannosaminyltransferase